MTIFILLLALFILQTIAVEIVQSFGKHPQAVQQPQPQYSEEDQKLWKIANSDKQFLPDGTIHLIHRPQYAPGRSDKTGVEQIFDVNNNLLWQGPAKHRPYKYLSWAPSRNSDPFLRWQMRYLQMILTETSRFLEIPVKTKDEILQIWRYIPDRSIFGGYGKNGTRISYLGSTGFVTSSPAAKPLGSFQSFRAWCPDDSYSPTLLWETTRRIYQINFEMRSIESLFESTDADVDRMIVHTWGPYKVRDRYDTEAIDDAQARDYRPFIYCRTQDGEYHLIMQNPTQSLTVAIPQEWHKWMGNSYSFTTTKKAVLMARQWTEHPAPPAFDARDPETRNKWLRDYRAKTKQCWLELYNIDDQGNLNLLNKFGWIKPAESPYPEQPQLVPIHIKASQWFGVVSPPLYNLVFRAFRPQLIKIMSQREYETSGELVHSLLLFVSPKSTINWLTAVAMAGLVFLHAWPRRTSYTKLVFWLIFTVLFSVTGLLTYLALNHTPTIKCQTCGKKRGLSQPDCPRCGAPLPIPQQRSFDLIFNT
jgi:hypothetical protein